MVNAKTNKLDNLAVTGLGMVSSIGNNILTSATSMKAGIIRISALQNLQVLDVETDEVEQATGQSISGLTDGFSGLGRLVRLGVAGLDDLVTNSQINDWSKIGFFINLSSGFILKECENAEIAESGISKDEMEQVTVPYDLDLRTQIYQTWLIPSILKLTKISIDPANQYIFFGDNSGIIHLIQKALDDLRSGKLEKCVIGGIDSLVEKEFLDSFNYFKMLKTPSRASGIIPGECAAFVCVEGESEAIISNRNIEAIIECPSERSESSNRFSPEPALGVSLSEAITASLNKLGDKGMQTELIIGNLNGDPYRATDWGCALIRLRVDFPWMDFKEWHPSLSFGEIGSATGPAAICMALRGFKCTNNILVWLANETGTRGSFYIRKYGI